MAENTLASAAEWVIIGALLANLVLMYWRMRSWRAAYFEVHDQFMRQMAMWTAFVEREKARQAREN
jgi:hypothetical protein